MDLRHLHRFLAVAEELHFARAAERLHIEQSPLSRSIKDLESDLGAVLFDRCVRGTRLTSAGRALLETVPRIFTAVEQARRSVEAVASGHRSTLRVALSDAIFPNRLASILALSREQEPDIEIRLFEMPLVDQLRGLTQDLYDIGFCGTSTVPEGIQAKALWRTQLVVAMPPRHPLLEYAYVPLAEALDYPMVRFLPRSRTSISHKTDELIDAIGCPPNVVESVESLELMITLITAGYGVGLVCEQEMALRDARDIVTRPLAGQPTYLTTYVLSPSLQTSPPHISRFIERAMAVAAEHQPTPHSRGCKIE